MADFAILSTLVMSALNSAVASAIAAVACKILEGLLSRTSFGGRVPTYLDQNNEPTCEEIVQFSQSGGHNFNRGFGNIDHRGVLIDMVNFNQIELSEDKQTCKIGAADENWNGLGCQPTGYMVIKTRRVYSQVTSLTYRTLPIGKIWYEVRVYDRAHKLSLMDALYQHQLATADNHNIHCVPLFLELDAPASFVGFVSYDAEPHAEAFKQFVAHMAQPAIGTPAPAQLSQPFSASVARVRVTACSTPFKLNREVCKTAELSVDVRCFQDPFALQLETLPSRQSHSKENPPLRISYLDQVDSSFRRTMPGPRLSREDFLTYIRHFNTRSYEKQHSFYAKDVVLILPDPAIPPLRGSEAIAAHYSGVHSLAQETVVPVVVMNDREHVFFEMEVYFKYIVDTDQGVHSQTVKKDDVFKVIVWALYDINEQGKMTKIRCNLWEEKLLGQVDVDELIQESKSRAQVDLQ
ncbi:hypothetical protein AC578_652 [Pseudocercospora eumusae]|uniref:SnoaL-like domain-containing protein n=1 Tax=Pseudocercospora eumusae TaxID=321146 RepID=A0A139HKZ1_9PEZI|nr:hypothetical protein AC578_652 [Pseudocercospora eumusae]